MAGFGIDYSEDMWCPQTLQEVMDWVVISRLMSGLHNNDSATAGDLGYGSLRAGGCRE